MNNFIKLFTAIILFLSAFGCQKSLEVSSQNTQNKNISIQPTQPKQNLSENQNLSLIEIPTLTNRLPEEIDKVLGKPAEIKKITEPISGEYRLYKTANFPKGLAVRFYGGKAKSFNLILEKPFLSSKEALLKSFGIDVGTAAPTIEKNEPLSDIWRGNFSNVKFKKVSAKRQKSGEGFVFVLAEIE